MREPPDPSGGRGSVGKCDRLPHSGSKQGVHQLSATHRSSWARVAAGGRIWGPFFVASAVLGCCTFTSRWHLVTVGNWRRSSGRGSVAEIGLFRCCHGDRSFWLEGSLNLFSDNFGDSRRSDQQRVEFSGALS